jgi:hypothetical protein
MAIVSECNAVPCAGICRVCVAGETAIRHLWRIRDYGGSKKPSQEPNLRLLRVMRAHALTL